MSSKFSNTTQTQKPPHICIKPPPGPQYIPPPLTVQQIQGYAEYLDPASPSEGGMITTINLDPAGAPNVWYGTAEANQYRIELIMQTTVQRQWIDFQLNWWVDGNLEAVVNGVQRPPRSWAPFASGHFDLFPTPFQGKAGCSLWF